MAALTMKPNSAYEIRHNAAVKNGGAMQNMLIGWKTYAEAHKRRYDSLIGEDYILGPAWKEIGEGIRTLLNGELGNLDGGTLDGFILDTLHENGFTEPS